MPKRYEVKLTDEERKQLLSLTRKGELKARELKRIQILLLVDEGKENKEISENIHVSMTTISRIRRRYAEEGIISARKERPRPGAKPILNGRKEAVLIAQVCSDPPDGRSHWTMQLLADRLVKLEVVDSISDETIRRSLKKVKSNHGSVASGVL